MVTLSAVGAALVMQPHPLATLFLGKIDYIWAKLAGFGRN